VIGSGPAGYVGAIRAAQLGMSTAVVEEWVDDKGKTTLGGTCLNVGCIPSKALLDSSQKSTRRRTALRCTASWSSLRPSMCRRCSSARSRSSSQLTGGIGGLFKHNGVTVIQGRGKVLAGANVEVTAPDGEVSVVEAGSVIIAAGSEPVTIPPAPVDNEYIVDSTGALEFTEVPGRLGVIGAGRDRPGTRQRLGPSRRRGGAPRGAG
jgi:dihydrolipoamide dehydrogenase